MQTPHASQTAGILERAGFLFRVIYLPLLSFAFFGVSLGVSIMAVFFNKSLQRSVEYIGAGGLVLIGWALFLTLVFLFFYGLAQHGVSKRARAHLGDVSWARQGWWDDGGQRVLGLVGVGPGRLVAAAFDGDGPSHAFEDVRAIELLPGRRPLQILMGHGNLRVFRNNGETWDVLVCGSRKGLSSIRAGLGLETLAADAPPQTGGTP